MFSFSFGDFVILFGVSCFGLYWYLTRNFDYWKKRNVVHDTPYPVLGTLGPQLILRKSHNDFIQYTYNKFPNDDLVGGFLSSQPLLMVKNPDMIKQILVKDFNNFRDRGFTVPDTNKEPLTAHLFVSTGDTWKALRQKLTPTFTSGKMRNGFPLLVESGKEFRRYLDDVLEDDQEPEIKELMAKLTTDVIGSYAFGIKMNSMKDENAPFRVMGRKIFQISTIKAIRNIFFIAMPSLFNILGIRITELEIEDFFIGLFKSVVQSRGNKPSERHDFIDLLIELKSKGHIKADKTLQDDSNSDNSLNIAMTDEILTAQAFVFFVAGFETSSSTMTFAMYELAMNMPAQLKVLEEIDRVLPKYNGEITYEALKEMVYLRMVINETLRKYPSLGTLHRRCEEPYTIPNTNVRLDKGVIIHIPVYAIHNDPKYFPEPEKFIPERFSPEEIEKRHPFVFFPFGEGPRNCIGERFAWLQMMVGLVTILQKYTLEADSKTVPKIKFNVNNFISTNDKGIYLKFKIRNFTTPTTEL